MTMCYTHGKERCFTHNGFLKMQNAIMDIMGVPDLRKGVIQIKDQPPEAVHQTICESAGRMYNLTINADQYIDHPLRPLVNVGEEEIPYDKLPKALECLKEHIAAKDVKSEYLPYLETLADIVGDAISCESNLEVYD